VEQTVGEHPLARRSDVWRYRALRTPSQAPPPDRMRWSAEGGATRTRPGDADQQALGRAAWPVAASQPQVRHRHRHSARRRRRRAQRRSSPNAWLDDTIRDVQRVRGHGRL